MWLPPAQPPLPLSCPGHPHNQNHNHDDDYNERYDLEYLKVARPTRHPGTPTTSLTPPSFIPCDTSTFLTPLWHRGENLTRNSFARATVSCSSGCSRRILEYRHRAPRACHCWYVAHSAESYPLACAADHKQNVLMPRYGFRLVTLMGEKENRPDVCQGIRQVPTPCSIALMIASVTLRYTSRFSVEVESMLEIV